MAAGYIWDEKRNEPAPPPRSCPRCDGKTRRAGNRHHSEVKCTECGWRKTVFSDGGEPA